MIELRNLSKSFVTADGPVDALKNVNLTINNGDIYGIIGMSGAGKSTLMKVLSGIHPYGSYEGQIIYDGKECRHQTIKDSEKLGIDPDFHKTKDIHIHVPEGAIPKDGPSAGITMITSIVSTYTGRKVNERIAMTGETTLRGRVMPVGGIKEKILAAKRAGIEEIILCEENRKDVEEIKAEYVNGLTFHYVSRIEQVLELALKK